MASTTPRSTRDSTPENNANGDDGGQLQAGDSPAVMTPRRKIGALLAGFDSDSDSPNEQQNTANPGKLVQTTQPTYTVDNKSKPPDPPPNNDSDGDGEDLPAAPRGRLAARMQAATTQGARPPSPKPAEQPVPTTAPQTQTRSPSPAHSNDAGDDSEDDIRPAAPRRKQVEHIASPSAASRRSESPLFVPMGSPEQPQNQRDSGNPDDDREPDMLPQDRVRALAARKREEREAKEREEAEKKAERMQRSSDLGMEFGSGEEDVNENENENEAGRKLTQQSRPARKAGKKAVLEMNRETQRISRNMQLTHQAATKKKIPLDSFLARFNQPKSNGASSEVGNSASARSHPPSSDVDAREPGSTPPTSPPPNLNLEDEDPSSKTNPQDVAATKEPNHAEDGVAGVEEHRATPAPPQRESKQPPPQEAKVSKRAVRVNLPRDAVAETQNHDSDSDLEVITSPSKSRRLAVFENLSLRNSHQSHSFQRLRTLANLHAPSGGHSTMNQADLEATLLRKAREQAAQERDEKIRRMREKGVNVQTAEERARTDNEVEDLMEKARGEADALAKKEKATKKGEDGEDALLDDDSDEDYDGGEEDGNEGEEEEDSEADDNDDEGGNDEAPEEYDENVGVTEETGLIEDHAEEEEEEEAEGFGSEADNSDREQTNASVPHRKGRSKFVVHDDDEDDEHGPEPAPVMSTPRPQPPDLGKQSGDFMGLSQAFAATLADNQDDTEQDSLAKLRQMPGMDLAMSELLEPDSQEVIRDSQEDQQPGSLDLLADYTQAGARMAADSPSGRTFTQYSQAPEPTQDAGFVMSPFDLTKRFHEPHSTVDTAPVNPEDTPLVKRGMRRLRRGQQQTPQQSDGEENEQADPSAFDIMHKATKEPQAAYDKKKSKAKDVVDEAAQESEDEYAGLGGASDEDSGSEAEYDRDMINDASGEVVDEKQLAAFNALVLPFPFIAPIRTYR